MKKVAVMIDGGFLIKIAQNIQKSFPTAQQIYDFAMSCIESDEELLRIYYYDCAPYGATEVKPLSGGTIDFSTSAIHTQQKVLQDKLARMNHIAFRCGVLSFNGWKIGSKALITLLKGSRPITASDLVPDLKQKRVDIKIGLDIAWLSSKSIVDRIVLVAGDADLIPAMKFARREGIQVVLVTLGNRIKPEMYEHTDIFRKMKWIKPTQTP